MGGEESPFPQKQNPWVESTLNKKNLQLNKKISVVPKRIPGSEKRRRLTPWQPTPFTSIPDKRESSNFMTEKTIDEGRDLRELLPRQNHLSDKLHILSSPELPRVRPFLHKASDPESETIPPPGFRQPLIGPRWKAYLIKSHEAGNNFQKPFPAQISCPMDLIILCFHLSQGC